MSETGEQAEDPGGEAGDDLADQHSRVLIWPKEGRALRLSAPARRRDGKRLKGGQL